MNALALSLTPFISSNESFLIKALLWSGEGDPSRENESEQGEGRGQTTMLTLGKKIA